MAELLYRYHRKIVPSYYNSAINASWEAYLVVMEHQYNFSHSTLTMRSGTKTQPILL